VPEGPNPLWCTDITYVRRWDAWAHPGSWSRAMPIQVVGWSVDNHMRSSLVTDAERRAIERRWPPIGQTVIHSDRGSQYTSHEILYPRAGERHHFPRSGIPASASSMRWRNHSTQIIKRSPSTWPDPRRRGQPFERRLDPGDHVVDGAFRAGLDRRPDPYQDARRGVRSPYP
jgi:transposase InsO family protein